MYKINIFDKISFFLVLLGSLNWGFIGLFKLNLVSLIVGGSVVLQRLIYVIIFIAAIDLIFLLIKCIPYKINN